MMGEALVKDGEEVAVGVGTGVLLEDEGAVRVVMEIEGWCNVGCWPV